MQNDRDRAIDGLIHFMRSDESFCLLTGTHQYEKHSLALAVMIGELPRGARLLFRANGRENAERYLGDIGISRAPAAGRSLTVQGVELCVDTMNPQSWARSPRPIDAAVVYPIDSLGPDRGAACVADLRARGASKVILVTWTDNFDSSWADSYDPTRVIRDAVERPDCHERVLTPTARAKTRQGIPRTLPAYAQAEDPRYLVRFHCDVCGSSRWARLNKEYPGLEVIRQAKHGEYEARCLICNWVARDNYNWYGQS